jgi:hypothetical protein
LICARLIGPATVDPHPRRRLHHGRGTLVCTPLQLTRPVLLHSPQVTEHTAEQNKFCTRRSVTRMSWNDGGCVVWGAVFRKYKNRPHCSEPDCYIDSYTSSWQVKAPFIPDFILVILVPIVQRKVNRKGTGSPSPSSSSHLVVLGLLILFVSATSSSQVEQRLKLCSRAEPCAAETHIENKGVCESFTHCKHILHHPIPNPQSPTVYYIVDIHIHLHPHPSLRASLPSSTYPYLSTRPPEHARLWF